MSPILIRARYVVANPALREAGVWSDGAVLVEHTRIVEVGAYADLRARYPQAPLLGSDRVMALPGFIDAHNHGEGVTTFSQGIVDDRVELRGKMGPRTPTQPTELNYWNALVAASRQIHSGITTTMPKKKDTPADSLQAYRADTEHVLQAYQASGMRLNYALGLADRANRLVYEENATFVSRLPARVQPFARMLTAGSEQVLLDDCLAYLEELASRFDPANRIRPVVAITGPQWISDPYLVRHRDTARRLGLGIHGPLLESVYQKLFAEREFGHTAIEHLNELGILGPGFSLAHGVWLTESDMDLVHTTGASVVHCPSSNLRVYSGIAPVPQMIARGVNVALAVDSEGINDNDDMFQEMRLALLLHRVPGPRVLTLDEWDVLTMATVNGARAVFLADRIGTLEQGKQADLILVNMDRWDQEYLNPSIHPVRALVQRGRPEDVELVMVDGQVICDHGHFAGFEADEARATLKQMLRRADWVSNPERLHAIQVLLPFLREYYDRWAIDSIDPFYKYNGRAAKIQAGSGPP